MACRKSSPVKENKKPSHSCLSFIARAIAPLSTTIKALRSKLINISTILMLILIYLFYVEYLG
jgi:hypothetical protein